MKTRTRNTQSQISHAEKWITNWHVVNKERLENGGVPISEVRREYESSTRFPMGPKSFTPLLWKIAGIESINIRNQWYYIIFH